MTLLRAQMQKLIDKKLHNASKSKGSLIRLSEVDCLDKNISNRLSWLTLKTKDFQVHQYYNVAFLDPKSERSQYEKG